MLQWKGGETEALARLHYYFWESKLLSNYKQTRNGMLGGDYSTKFSAWLAHGNISPRTIYHEVGCSCSAGHCQPEHCVKWGVPCTGWDGLQAGLGVLNTARELVTREFAAQPRHCKEHP